MKIIFFFLISCSLTQVSLAQDKNCDAYKTQWKLDKITGASLNQFNAQFELIEYRIMPQLYKQVEGWRKIYAAHPECFELQTGMKFDGEKVIITKPSTAEYFRLSEVVPSCNNNFWKDLGIELSRLREAAEPKPIKYGDYEIPRMQQDGIGAYEKNNQEVKELTAFERQKQIWDELETVKDGLGALREVGKMNYCQSHLRAFYLNERSNKAHKEFNLCKEMQDNGTMMDDQGKPISPCQHFPNAYNDYMSKLQKEMEKLYPYHLDEGVIFMSDYDKNVYHKYKDNIQALKEAQAEAKKRITQSQETQKFLDKADLIKDCDLDNNKYFVNGLGCRSEDYTTIIEPKQTGLNDNFDVVKAIHREDLLLELNGQALKKTTEVAFYLLENSDDPKARKLFSEISNYKKAGKPIEYDKVCKIMLLISLELTENSPVCEGEYLKQFSAGLDRVLENYERRSHPLSWDSDLVTNKINTIFSDIHSLCTRTKIF